MNVKQFENIKNLNNLTFPCIPRRTNNQIILTKKQLIINKTLHLIELTNILKS